MEYYLIFLLNGIAYAMLLFLVTLGFTIQFGILGVLNLAHGSFYMLGAYLAFSLTRLFAGLPSNFWLALIVAPLIIATLGGVLEWGLLRRIYGRDLLFQYLFTYTWILILDDAVKMIWGPNYRSVSMPDLISSPVSIFGFTYSSYHLFVIAFGVVVMIGLWFLLYKTRWGKIVRAAATNKEMVSALGVNTPLLFTMIFAIGAWLAGLGGVLAAPLQTVYPGMGLAIIVDAFIVVVIGGMGSLKGALLGAFLIGIMRSFGILFVPRLEMAFAFILMAIILILRPQGLFGRKEAKA